VGYFCCPRQTESVNSVEVWDDPIKMIHFVALLFGQAGNKEKQTDNKWILNTRATAHIKACNGRMTEIESVGGIMVQGSFGNTHTPILIRNVLYAPGLTNNLLSGIMLMEAGLKGELHESGLDLCDQTSRELHLRMRFLRGVHRVVLRPVCPAAQDPLDYGNHSQGHCLTSQLDANLSWEPLILGEM